MAYSDYSHFYNIFYEEFSKYAKTNNIEIDIKLNTLSNSNSTVTADSVKTLLRTLYAREDIKYDLFFFDNQDIKDLDNYLLDLRNEISEDRIELYDPDILSLTCNTNNKLVGLVRFKYILL